MVSGLHWTMPNGTSAPGKVFPPPLVQVRVSTRLARSFTGAVTLAWSFAPGGSCAGRTAWAQDTSRPWEFWVQVAVRLPTSLIWAAVARCAAGVVTDAAPAGAASTKAAATEAALSTAQPRPGVLGM